MAYNNPGTISPKEEDSGLTVKIGVPKWLKTMWSNTVGRWFKHDDVYSAFFKLLVGSLLAPLAGAFLIGLNNSPMPFIVSQLIVIVGLLGIIAMARMDDSLTAKEMFWIWMTTTVAFYVAAVIGLIEIYGFRAMFM